MTDIVANKTLPIQWNETVNCYPDKIFMEYITTTDEHFSYTYREFDEKVKKAANFFIDLGIQKGDFVALHLHNSPEYAYCWLALAHIGAISVPQNEHYRIYESSYAIAKCHSEYVIIEDRVVDVYDQTNPDAVHVKNTIIIKDTVKAPHLISLQEGMKDQPTTLKEERLITVDDMAVILFTSGTTSRPKGAIYTHYNVVFGGLIHVAQMGMGHGDRFLTSMPCYHMDFQEMAITPCIVTGSTLIMIEHYSARRFWKQIVDYKATITDTMSIMNRTMMLQPVQPWEKDHCVRHSYFSMGMSDEEKDAFEERFNVSLLNSYGSTESVSGVTCAPFYGEKNWPSVGRAAYCYELKIIDSHGKEVPPNTVGEICIHGIPGKTIISGYYNDHRATAKLIDKDNWMHTGDKGYIDEGGWLFFVDRSCNLIKVNGENVSSLEVECVLTSHEKIADAAVIGIPHPIYSQEVKAFIQLAEGQSLTEDEIWEYCEANLSKFKVPSILVFVEDFPRTSTGKIQKQKLRNAENQDN